MKIEWVDRDGLFCLRTTDEMVGICGTPIREGEPFLDARVVDLDAVGLSTKDVMNFCVAGCSRCAAILLQKVSKEAESRS